MRYVYKYTVYFILTNKVFNNFTKSSGLKIQQKCNGPLC